MIKKLKLILFIIAMIIIAISTLVGIIALHNVSTKLLILEAHIRFGIGVASIVIVILVSIVQYYVGRR